MGCIRLYVVTAAKAAALAAGVELDLYSLWDQIRLYIH